MELVKEYEWIIYSVMKYFNNYDNKEDLFQVGVIGLLYAYKNYDSKLGCKFSTYAYTYVLGEMRKLVREDKNIKISKNISMLYKRIDRTKELLYQKYLKEPTTKEIADFLEIDEYLVIEAINSNNRVESLDNTFDDYNLYDIVGYNIDNIDLKYAIENLSEEERKLINSRYFNGYSQDETAKLLNTNQVKVSRNEKKILVKLRNQLIS